MCARTCLSARIAYSAMLVAQIMATYKDKRKGRHDDGGGGCTVKW